MKSNQKGFAMLVGVLIALSLAAVISGAYLYATQIAKPKPAPVAENVFEDISQETAPEPVAESDQFATTTLAQNKTADVADWQIYRNEKCGFEIKYPAGYFPKENSNGVVFATAGLANCDNMANKGDEVFCSEVEMSISPIIDCSSAEERFEGRDFKTYLAQRTAKNFPVKKIVVGGVFGFEIEDQGMAGGYKSVYFLKGDNLINFVVANEVNEKGTAFLEQIVSTFKFVEPQKDFDLSEAEILEQLKSAEHLCYGFLGGDKVRFEQGIYKETAVESASEPYCKIYENFIVYDDFNGDKLKDAALVIASSGGGSGTFFELEVFLNKNGIMNFADKTMIDDRARINSLVVENGQIILNFIGHSPNDGMCCPTKEMIWKFRLENEKLVRSV